MTFELLPPSQFPPLLQDLWPEQWPETTALDRPSQAVHMDEDKDKDDVVDVSPATETDEEKTAAFTTTPLTPPPPIQDGGARAWLQVAGSFLVFANLWGFAFAFGTFQSYYEVTYLPHQTASTISWIGTVSTFFLIEGGVLSGPLFDLGYFRSMLFLGAAIEVLAVFLTSLCDTYWQLFLAQGLLMGLGNGLLYVPGLALVGRSFKTHRAMAMGITTCGAPTGGVLYTLVFEQLIGRMSFGWTVRIMGFIMLGMYLVSFPLLLFKADNTGDLSSGTKRKLFDRSALTDLPFWSYTISSFFIFFGYMVPFIYFASYGQLELGLSRSASLTIIMISQAASIIGRLIAGFCASRIGVMVPWTICAMSSGIICIAWVGAREYGPFVAVAALYGCFSGALIPLPPSVFPVVCPDPKVLGARLGMAQGISAFASLIGSPIAGALAETTAGNKYKYLGLQLFGGLVMFFGGCSLIVLWVLLIKKRNVGIFI